MNCIVKQISDMPSGSLVSYRGKPYFVSEGLEDRIVTDIDGHWIFLRELKWKSFHVLWEPKTRIKLNGFGNFGGGR